MKIKRKTTIILATILLVNSISIEAARAGSAGSITSIYGSRSGTIPLASMHEPESGFNFSYPKTWKRTNDNEKDTLIKLSGTTEGRYGDFKISKIEDTASASQMKTAVQSMFEQTFAGTAKVEERQIRFGTKLQFTGDELHLTFKMGEAPYRTRMVLFTNQGHNYLFSMICLVSEHAVMQPVFDQILASVHSQSGSVADASLRSKAAPGNIAAVQEWNFDRYTDKSGQVSIVYPTGWKIENQDPGKEFEVTFRGTNAKKLPAEIVLARSTQDQTMPLDQFINIYEANYLKPLPNFKNETSRHTTFGITHLDGSVRYSSFSSEGHPGR